jgi:hypothetical protein
MKSWKAWWIDRSLLLLTGIFATCVAVGLCGLLGNYTLLFCYLASYVGLLTENIRLRKELKRLQAKESSEEQK